MFVLTVLIVLRVIFEELYLQNDLSCNTIHLSVHETRCSIYHIQLLMLYIWACFHVSFVKTGTYGSLSVVNKN